MSENEDRDRNIIPSGGLWQDFTLRVRLILRLLADERISIFLKLLPVASFTYVLFPDLAPGPIDDAAVIWLGFTMFVELCPPHVVQEHLEEMTRTVSGEWRDAPDIHVSKPNPHETGGEVVDAQFRDQE